MESGGAREFTVGKFSRGRSRKQRTSAPLVESVLAEVGSVVPNLVTVQVRTNAPGELLADPPDKMVKKIAIILGSYMRAGQGIGKVLCSVRSLTPARVRMRSYYAEAWIFENVAIFYQRSQ